MEPVEVMIKAEFEEWSRRAEVLRDEALERYKRVWRDDEKVAVIEELPKVLNQA